MKYLYFDPKYLLALSVVKTNGLSYDAVLPSGNNNGLEWN